MINDAESGRYTMHAAVIQPPSCYRCYSCGFCGDFKREGTGEDWEQMETCFGGTVPFQVGWSADNTWEVSFRDEGTTTTAPPEGAEPRTKSPTPAPVEYIPDPGDLTVVDPCDHAIEADVVAACQQARDARSDCCDELQANCNFDACVAAESDVSAIAQAVEKLLTNEVDLVCTQSVRTTAECADDANCARSEHCGEGGECQKDDVPCYSDDECRGKQVCGEQGICADPPKPTPVPTEQGCCAGDSYKSSAQCAGKLDRSQCERSAKKCHWVEEGYLVR